MTLLTGIRAGQVFACGPFTTTALATLDWETYSEAGYVWQPEAIAIDSDVFASTVNTTRGKWSSLPGLAATNRGLKAVGLRNYVCHPSFAVLSLAYDLLDDHGLRHWVPPADLRPLALCEVSPPPGHPLASSPFDHGPYGDARHPWDLIRHVERGGIIEAWNVGFELTVWNYYCVHAWGWPELKFEQVRCCMAKARAAAYPGALEHSGTVLKLIEQKDKAGKDLVRKLTVPRNPTKANPALKWTPFTATEDFQRFYEYNKQDVRTELEASLRIPDLPPSELLVWLKDLHINQRGMQVDLEAVGNCIAIVEQAFDKYNAEIRALTNGAVDRASEGEKTLAWLRGRGVYLYELDEDTVTEALKREQDPTVKRVLELRQLLALASIKKLYAFRAQSTPSGRLHDQFAYHGAHTGLWNGQGVQVANLYSGEFKRIDQVERALQIIASRNLALVEWEYGPHGSWCAEDASNKAMNALECVASCLRSMIIAAPGCDLISSDFSAIQAVVTSALAGEEWRLEVFRTHGMIYETQASRLRGLPLQYYIDYKKQNGKHHQDRQDWGKLPVLSGDFGAWIEGWKRFKADEILGSDDNIKAAILKTRDSIPNIVEMWGGQTRDKFRDNMRAELYGLEGAAISAVMYPGQAFGYRGMVYQTFEDTLYCSLPSTPSTGSFMVYHSPRLERSSRNYAAPWELELSYSGWNSNQLKGAGGWVSMKLYGGVQTQNNVAHESTQVQRAAMIALEDSSYPVVFHNHDELAAERRIGEGSIDEYLAIVRGSLPGWACSDGKPWPIKVPDAWRARRYGKWG